MTGGPELTAWRALGAAVRDTRERHGLSQGQLAVEAGLHRNTIGLIERGEYDPRLSSLRRLAEALLLSPAQLLELAEELELEP